MVVVLLCECLIAMYEALGAQKSELSMFIVLVSVHYYFD